MKIDFETQAAAEPFPDALAPLLARCVQGSASPLAEVARERGRAYRRAREEEEARREKRATESLFPL